MILVRDSFPILFLTTTSLKVTLSLAENTLILRIPKYTCGLACWAAYAQYSNMNWVNPEEWCALWLSPVTYAFLTVAVFKNENKSIPKKGRGVYY